MVREELGSLVYSSYPAGSLMAHRWEWETRASDGVCQSRDPFEISGNLVAYEYSHKHPGCTSADYQPFLLDEFNEDWLASGFNSSLAAVLVNTSDKGTLIDEAITDIETRPVLLPLVWFKVDADANEVTRGTFIIYTRTIPGAV